MKHNGKNTLDEMQDQKMLKMEEYGYWILFWGLALAVVIQLLLGGSIRQVGGGGTDCPAPWRHICAGHFYEKRPVDQERCADPEG